MLELIKIENGRIYFKTTDVVTANYIGGQAVKGQWNTYRVFLTLDSIKRIFVKLDKDDIKAKKILKNAHVKLQEYVLNLNKLKTLKDCEGDSRLRPYQRVDVRTIKELGESKIILNQQRTGKTPTTLVSLMEEGIKTAILVCPASLLYQWANEVFKWSYYPQIVIEGKTSERKEDYELIKKSLKENKELIVIISYETLREDMTETKRKFKVGIDDEGDPIYETKTYPAIFPNVRFDALIIDEAHRLRNHQSGQSEALYKLGKRVNYKYLLTGTPTINSADEVFGILKMAYPDMYSSYWEFANYYFDVSEGRYTMYEVGDVKRKKELQSVIYMLSVQRKRKDVMQWLPEKDYQRVNLDFDNKQKKSYIEMLNMFETEHVSAVNVLSQLTRLKQITMNPAILELEGKSPKEEYILNFLDNNAESSILIFSTSTKFLNLLAQKLKVKFQMITGEVPKKLRNDIKEQFQAGEVKVLLLNIKASQEGLTLDQADYCIFADRLYEYELNIQAEDRFIPISKERVKPKTIIDLVINGSVDERLYDEILVRKGNATKIVNDIGLKGFLK